MFTATAFKQSSDYFSQGIEGTYITFHPDYSPEDDDPLQGIQFITSSSLGQFYFILCFHYSIP